MTVAANLAIIVKTAYTSSQQTDAITVAESLLSGITENTITSNQDDSWDTTIIELALKVLQVGPLLEENAINPQSILVGLITKDMRNAVRVVTSDETDSFIFKNKGG